MKTNIVLIGMSGAGKTTLGRILSYKLKMAFVDMDKFLEQKHQMSVSEIFEKYGEEYFREEETKTAKFLSENYTNTIISTGGGVVLKSENICYLKTTGTIVYINRTVESILTTLNAEKRPLLKNNPQKLYDMYKERHKLYLNSAEISVMNNGNIDDCIGDIIDVLELRNQEL